MAGYIGKSQSVILTNESDTLDDVTARGATTTNNLDVGTVTADGLTVDTDTLVVDTTNNRVGIGTSSPASVLHIKDTAGTITAQAENGLSGCILNVIGGGTAVFRVQDNGTERMRIDSSGNLLVGKTAEGVGNVGVQARPDGFLAGTRNGGSVSYLNRLTSDGEILRFQKDNSAVGYIGASSGVVYMIGPGGFGLNYTNGAIYPSNAGAAYDDAYDCGASFARFDDIYATNGTIQTSDRNEKQDIEKLSEAEQRVAVACKGLLRKFRWKSAVEEKGDDARIHFGIIAQDLQAAFEAEGLDAGRYAMFIYSEWWETYTDVPAVEAQDAVYETVTDEEGNETQVLVSEAVEAKEAYTRTDTYETAEEAPEGAVERTRLGVRYPELLAFIIAAI